MQQFLETSVMKKLRPLATLRKAKTKSMTLPVIAALLEIKSSADDVETVPRVKVKARTQKLALRRCSLRILATPMKLLKQLLSLLLPLMK